MRPTSFIPIAIAAAMTASVAAQTAAEIVADPAPERFSPVVVELYTAQGCSSCPPADAFLDDIADRDDVIALSLHVDYWDYIGWVDIFARPEFTERQKAYALANGTRSVYTPQMVVDGRHLIAGARAMHVAQHIFGGRDEADRVVLSVAREGSTLTIEVRAIDALAGPANVYVVRYISEETVEIDRGENAGRTIRYRNIVTDWKQVAVWDGEAPLALVAEAPGDAAVAVIVQSEGPGEVLAATQFR